MNIKIIFKVFVFVLIPLYIFINPTIEYLSNLNTITYTLDVPTQSSEVTNNTDKIKFLEAASTQDGIYKSSKSGCFTIVR